MLTGGIGQRAGTLRPRFAASAGTSHSSLIATQTDQARRSAVRGHHPDRCGATGNLGDEFTAQTAFTLHQTGYGLGQRIAATPNVLRVFLGEQPDHDPATEMVEELCLLECNLDDLNPELYEHVMNRLFQQGALEVYWTPVVMKKSRPGVLLSVLCEPPLIANVMAVLFAETTTLGVRQQRVSRTALVREIVNVTTRYGQVRVKTAHYHQQLVNCKAEYEDCKRLAEAFAIPLKVIYAEVNRAIAAQIDGVFPAYILPPL